jgi:uncharacterized protein YecA (UPF0149 family)
MDVGVLFAMLLYAKMPRRARPIDAAQANSTGPVVITVTNPPAPGIHIVSGSARNKPCHCGSGKKLKKCCRTNAPAVAQKSPHAAGSAEKEN